MVGMAPTAVAVDRDIPSTCTTMWSSRHYPAERSAQSAVRTSGGAGLRDARMRERPHQAQYQDSDLLLRPDEAREPRHARAHGGQLRGVPAASAFESVLESGQVAQPAVVWLRVAESGRRRANCTILRVRIDRSFCLSWCRRRV